MTETRYNISELCEIVAPHIFFDDDKKRELWIYLCRRKERKRFAEMNNTFINIRRKIFLLNETSKKMIMSWIEIHRNTLLDFELVTHTKNLLLVLNVFFATEVYIPPPIRQVICAYLGIDDSCLFCRSLQGKQVEGYKYLCLCSPICQCGVSFFHHYVAVEEDWNQISGFYNSIMVPAHFNMDNPRHEEFYCPFGICECCDASIPSFKWPSLVFNSSNACDYNDLYREFESQISRLFCFYCPKCNPKCLETYTCSHMKRTLTRFKPL